jgi:hypothetical protein
MKALSMSTSWQANTLIPSDHAPLPNALMSWNRTWLDELHASVPCSGIEEGGPLDQHVPGVLDHQLVGFQEHAVADDLEVLDLGGLEHALHQRAAGDVDRLVRRAGKTFAPSGGTCRPGP